MASGPCAALVSNSCKSSIVDDDESDGGAAKGLMKSCGLIAEVFRSAEDLSASSAPHPILDRGPQYTGDGAGAASRLSNRRQDHPDQPGPLSDNLQATRVICYVSEVAHDPQLH